LIFGNEIVTIPEDMLPDPKLGQYTTRALAGILKALKKGEDDIGFEEVDVVSIDVDDENDSVFVGFVFDGLEINMTLNVGSWRV